MARFKNFGTIFTPMNKNMEVVSRKRVNVEVVLVTLIAVLALAGMLNGFVNQKSDVRDHATAEKAAENLFGKNVAGRLNLVPNGAYTAPNTSSSKEAGETVSHRLYDYSLPNPSVKDMGVVVDGLYEAGFRVVGPPEILATETGATPETKCLAMLTATRSTTSGAPGRPTHIEEKTSCQWVSTKPVDELGHLGKTGATINLSVDPVAGLTVWAEPATIPTPTNS